MEASKIFRFEFSESLVEKLGAFSKQNELVDRETFKDEWKKWLDENQALVEEEDARLKGIGYQGNIQDKMYKSSRYYFRKKSTAKKALKRKTRRMRGGAEVAFDSEAAQQRIRSQVGVKMMRLLNISNDGRRLNDSGRSREQKAIINRIISELPDDLLNTAFEEVRLRGLFSHCSNDDEIVKLEIDLMDIALIYVQIKNIGGHNPNTSFFLSPIHDRISFFSRAGRLRIEESERRRRDMTMREAEEEIRRRLQSFGLPEVAEANDTQPATAQEAILAEGETIDAIRQVTDQMDNVRIRPRRPGSNDHLQTVEF